MEEICSGSTIIGNGCGHNPKYPRFYIRPENHKKRPPVLEKAISALSRSYKFPKKILKSISSVHPQNRLKRSERREAIISLSQVLLHYIDLETLKVGFNKDHGKFLYLDIKYIANKAGISLTRAKRAATDLVKAGYLEVKKQFDHDENGVFKGLPSIRKLSVQFFIDLGLDISALFFSREWKRKKQEKVDSKKSRGTMSKMFKSVLSFSPKKVLSSNSHAGKSLLSDLSVDQRKAATYRAMELHKKNPCKTITEYLKELLR